MCQTLIKECHSLWFDIRVPFKSAIQVCHLLDKIPGCHKDFQSRRCKRPWCFRRPSRQTHETSSARQLEFFFVFSRWAYEVRRCRRQLTYRSSFAYKQIRAASCCQSQSECNPKHYRIVLGDGGGYAWWVVFALLFHHAHTKLKYVQVSFTGQGLGVIVRFAVSTASDFDFVRWSGVKLSLW